MVKISQKEAFELRKRGLGSYVSMSGSTNKSRGKRYWAAENNKVFKILNKMRKSNTKEER